MQDIAGPFPRADAAPTQPQGRPGKHCVASAHKRSMREVEMGDVGAERDSEAKIALAVPAWHLSVHRTVFYRLDGKIQSL